MGTRRLLCSLLAVVAVAFPSLAFAQIHNAAQADAPLNLAPADNLRKTVTVDVVARAKNTIVYISTEKVVYQRVSPFGNDPIFGNVGAREQASLATSLGSGFIIHESGYIVTNNHVIDRARKVQVQLSDDRKFAAEVVSTDPDADLAILKIESKEPLPTLPLGDSSDLMIGEPVIAIGNPLGYSYSVSTGIVSAIHREIQTDSGKAALSDVIQTDAAVNPGNSGGPLLNAYGQVIGINTAIANGAQNIGFAIQVNTLRKLIPDLMDPAKVNKLKLAVTLAERRTLTPPATVKPEVLLMTPGGEKTVTAINGKKPRDIIDAYAFLLALGTHDTANITTSDGANTAIVPSVIPIPDAIASARRRLGITVEPVTPSLAERVGLRTESGMLITELVRRSIGEKTGLQPGDVIFQLGRFRVTTLDEFGQLISLLPEKGQVRIGILRGDAIFYGALQL